MASNSLNANELEIKVQERIAELERANQELRAEILKHRQAEEAFRECEEKYCNIIEAVNEGIWVVDPEARIAYANKKMAEMLGYTLDEILGRYSWDFTDEENKLIIKKNIERRKQGIDESYEFKFIRKNGSPLWALINAKSYFDKDGKFTGSVGTLSDITEYKRAKETLIKSEEGFRTLAENSPDWIARLDRQKRYMYINPAAVEFYGIPKEVIIGKTNTELGINPEKAEFWDEYFEKVFATGKPETIEYLYRLPEGKEYYFDTQIVPEFVNGEITSILAISRNITGIKEAEAKLKETLNNLESLVRGRTSELEKAYESLKESEQGLSNAQKMAHIGNWEWNLATGEVYWSDELYRIFGHNPEEPGASYEELLDYIHPNSRDYVGKTINSRLDGCDDKGIDYRIVLANGEERIVHSQSEIIVDEQNNPVKAKGIVQDITERKKAEETLEKMERIRIKEIHHRIKNNLQVISSLLDLQAEKFRDKEVLEAFRESQSRIFSMSLIHEELYRGEEIDELDFSEYLEKLAENLLQTYSLNGKNIDLYMNLEENAFFDTDIAVPLGIIVNELLSNSLKHAFPGTSKGMIQVKLFSKETVNDLNNKEQITGEEDRYTLVISDNGTGIPEDVDFENPETLGMQLVSTLVDQLNARIELRRNRGTEYIIRFSSLKNETH